MPSVEPPSTTMCSSAGYACARTLASVAGSVAAAFRHGVMIVSDGSAGSGTEATRRACTSPSACSRSTPGRMGGTETYVARAARRVRARRRAGARDRARRPASGARSCGRWRAGRWRSSEIARRAARGRRAGRAAGLLRGHARAAAAARRLAAEADVLHLPLTVPVPAAPRRATVLTLHDVLHHELPAHFPARRAAFRRARLRPRRRGAPTRVVTDSEHARGRIVAPARHRAGARASPIHPGARPRALRPRARDGDAARSHGARPARRAVAATTRRRCGRTRTTSALLRGARALPAGAVAGAVRRRRRRAGTALRAAAERAAASRTACGTSAGSPHAAVPALYRARDRRSSSRASPRASGSRRWRRWRAAPGGGLRRPGASPRPAAARRSRSRPATSRRWRRR